MLTLLPNANAWLEYKLDPESRRFRRHFLLKPDHNLDRVFHGFANIEPVWWVFRRFYAVYGYKGRLWFQAGRKRWDITDGFETCKFWWLLWGAASGLILKFKNGESHRPVLIHPGRALWLAIDPTYDGIDAESEHFFMFLRQCMVKPEWRTYVINLGANSGNDAQQVAAGDV